MAAEGTLEKFEPIDLRITVGNAVAGMGFVWRIFSNRGKSDVHMIALGVGKERGMKFSFHKERLRYALIKTPTDWPIDRDRALFKWTRKPIPDSGLEQCVPVFQIEIPTNYLGPFRTSTKKTIFISPALAGRSIIIIGAYTNEPRALVESKLGLQARLIHYSYLPEDASFFIFSFEALSENYDLITEGALGEKVVVFASNQSFLDRQIRIHMCNDNNAADAGFAQILELGGVANAPLPSGQFSRLHRDHVFASSRHSK